MQIASTLERSALRGCPVPEMVDADRAHGSRLLTGPRRAKPPGTTADPGNSGILGRSERHHRPGFGSHRYIPVNPLLLSLTTLKPQQGYPGAFAYRAVCGGDYPP